MGKRFKELQAELAAKTAALAESQERHSRATAHVGELKRAERERIEGEHEQRRQAQKAERQALQLKQEQERLQQEAEELDRLRHGVVKIDNASKVDLSMSVDDGDHVVITRPLSRQETIALKGHLDARRGRATGGVIAGGSVGSSPAFHDAAEAASIVLGTFAPSPLTAIFRSLRHS